MATRENGLLTTLNAKLAKRIEAEQAIEATPAPQEPVKAPTVLGVLEEAIASMPGTDIEWSVAQRYGIGEFKERCFRAREALCTVRSLLVDGD